METDRSKVIVVMGRGGTGKTSFVALIAKYYIEKGRYPLLLVDLDPDQNLGEMVGVDLKNEGKKTISELLVETFLEKGGTLVGVPPSDRIEGKMWEEGIHEGEYFDMMAVGPKWIEGCYCLPDAALKRALSALTRMYRCVLIDSPAGLEHLNRKISSWVDTIFNVIDPSIKSYNHIRRAYRVAKEVEITFNDFYVVGGYRFPERMGGDIEGKTGLRYLGNIFYDREVAERGLSGESLLQIPDSSPAYQSVSIIMERAGY